MNYCKISKMDTANGKGIGTVLWVSGCSHHCKGCHNPETWSEKSGQKFTSESFMDLVANLDFPWVKRLTLSGGDPMYSVNRPTILKIVQKIKELFPEKKIWMYTGYTFEEIEDSPILEWIDVLVDGEFREDLKDISLPFCGSSNQRIIDVPLTLESKRIVEM